MVTGLRMSGRRIWLKLRSLRVVLLKRMQAYEIRISDWSSDVCSSDLRFAVVNGLPGFVTREPDGVLQTTALLIEDGLIRAIYVMRNPDKLRHLERSVH